MLPMHWSYYLWNLKAKMGEAFRLAELAQEHQKNVIVWYSGDLVPIIPFENTLVFLPGIVKSKARQNQRACPAFIDDPEPIFRNAHDQYRKKQEKPSIGFCGYASEHPAKILWSIFKGTQLNLSSRLGGYEYSAVPIVPATVIRARALRLLSRHPAVNPHFVIRDRYTERRSRNLSTDIAKASQAFYSNIYETDYTLCVRGYGNWSYRFYETLACGRIPVLIDTDCVLPYGSTIDWKKYCVWIDRSELGQMGEKIADFHFSLSPTAFIELQIACRELWRERLTLDGFMAHILEYFPNALSKRPLNRTDFIGGLIP
jgi:hypothetical protein